MPRLEAAVNALDSPAARIPWEDPVTRRGGLRRVVSVTDIPRGPGKLDDVLTLTVHLPPGTGAGPSKTNQDGGDVDIRYLKNGAAAALRKLREHRSPDELPLRGADPAPFARAAKPKKLPARRSPLEHRQSGVPCRPYQAFRMAGVSVWRRRFPTRGEIVAGASVRAPLG